MQLNGMSGHARRRSAIVELRLLAGELKIGNTTVARAWRAYGIKPWEAESFRFSIDPELVGKVTDRAQRR
jgi:hypothetical protein